jgi:hypothetical protein
MRERQKAGWATVGRELERRVWVGMAARGRRARRRVAAVQGGRVREAIVGFGVGGVEVWRWWMDGKSRLGFGEWS